MIEEQAQASLIDRAGVTEKLALNPSTENAWIEVIQKMDEVYADLVRYQVELEEKNSALEEAQQFIRSVLASMTDILIVCDVNGRIEQVNSALERLTGRPTSELLHQPVEALFMPDSKPLAVQLPEKVGKEAFVDCEVNLVGFDGEPAPMAMNFSSQYDHEGRLVGMVIIGRPVAELRRAYDELNSAHHELKQTQQQLIHTEKMASLGRLVAGVAHELNNPISFVFGNMHALKRYGDRMTRYLTAIDAGTDEESLKALRSELKIDRILGDMGSLIDGTLEGAERVSDIVQGLRRYSNSRKESLEPFDLVDVVRTAANWVLKVCRTKPQVDYHLPDSLPIISRKGHVHQILVNLIQNAVDVMEESEELRLELTCEMDGEKASITVCDHGPGIPEDELSRVFDPFYTTKPVGKGTGLGLYISYGMAADLNGELRVVNHPEGGALFTLILPREGEVSG